MTRFRSLGLRAELALAIVLVTAAAVLASFLAVYSGTSARLRSQIDSQLRTQAAEWRGFTAGTDLSTASRLRRTGIRFIASQRYHAESLVIVVQPYGGRALTNSPELLAAEEANVTSAHGLLSAPTGLTTASVPEAGSMRVLVSPILSQGHRVGSLRVANPLTPVEQAQASLRQIFVIVGTAAVVLAALIGFGVAALIAAPLRRITAVAAAVNAGDLSRRAGPTDTRGELSVLAGAFDAMLDRLERAFKREHDFVSDASHELRTPLAVMRAQVELIDRTTTEPDRHGDLAVLLARLDELDRLVGDLLTLAGAEAGELIQPEIIDLDDFFEDLRRDLPLFGERDFRLDAIDGTLEANPARLTQVLRNLVRNAVAHTDPQDRIDVRAHANGEYLELSVIDTGPGIPRDELDQVFERFHRLDHSRSRHSGGTGLGLAIARAIVEEHGGRIWAESEEGAGATFRVELPGYAPTGSSAPEEAR